MGRFIFQSNEGNFEKKLFNIYNFFLLLFKFKKTTIKDH